jgi:Uri superfamily endonuclease
MLAALPTSKGTYILLLRLDEPARLAAGRLGTFDFPAGWYAYTGSAFGPGGLRGRLKHHLTPVTKPHWHIDYLRQIAPVHTVWYTASETVYEHDWAAALRALPGAAVPARRFGASDCDCITHLIHFPTMPDAAGFERRSGQSIKRLSANS